MIHTRVGGIRRHFQIIVVRVDGDDLGTSAIILHVFFIVNSSVSESVERRLIEEVASGAKAEKLAMSFPIGEKKSCLRSISPSQRSLSTSVISLH